MTDRESACFACQAGAVQVCVELECDANGLTACRLSSSRELMPGGGGNSLLCEAEKQLRAYFAGEGHALDVPLSTSGTEFQQRVWDACRTIPFGETRSYGWLAQKIGNHRSVRAVAGALGANRIMLLIPCHRVIQTNGGLGGFSCGIEWKELLLAHELASVQEKDSHIP